LPTELRPSKPPAPLLMLHNPSRVQRGVIFAREQQHMARLQAQGAFTESALDLAGYVEFNRNYKCVNPIVDAGVGGRERRG
jgi:hypothetical protein